MKFPQKLSARLNKHRVLLALVRVSGLVSTAVGFGIVGWHIADNCTGVFPAGLAGAFVGIGYIARRG